MSRSFFIVQFFITVSCSLSAQYAGCGQRIHLQQLSEIDTLVPPQREFGQPVLETLGINLAVWSWDRFVQRRDWSNVTSRTINYNLHAPFVLDYDSYSGNQFSHPFHGSMFFNTARYHGANYYAAALYPLLGSMTWEYFCERNPPSINDILSTGVGGSIIGEATHRMSDLIFDNSKTGVQRFASEIFGSILNPPRGIHRILSGEAWRISNKRGKRVKPEPFSIDMGVGNRHMAELRGERRNQNLPFLSFNLNYGNRFTPSNHHVPFDFFRMHILFNIAEKCPTFNDIDIRGRLISHQFKTKDGSHHNIGLHQVYRYIDNYGEKGNIRAGQFPIINEACSFGFAIASEKCNTRTTWCHELMTDGIAFGGTTSDYFQPRTYNFAQGFSLRDELSFCLHRRLTIGNDFYFARLFVHNGCDDPTRTSDFFWGDQGTNSIFLNRSYLHCNLISNIRLCAEYALYYRRSHYTHYPNVHAKSHEHKIGILYGL